MHAARLFSHVPSAAPHSPPIPHPAIIIVILILVMAGYMHVGPWSGEESSGFEVWDRERTAYGKVVASMPYTTFPVSLSSEQRKDISDSIRWFAEKFDLPDALGFECRMHQLRVFLASDADQKAYVAAAWSGKAMAWTREKRPPGIYRFLFEDYVNSAGLDSKAFGPDRSA